MIVLSLEHFIPPLNCYDYRGRRDISAFLINNVIDNSTLIPMPEMAETILTFLGPLIYNQCDGPTAEQSRYVNKEEWEEEHSLKVRLVQLLVTPEPGQQRQVLTAARKHLRAEGGALSMSHTLPPLVFQAYQLARRIHTAKDTDTKVGCQGGEDIQVLPQVTLLPFLTQPD